MYIYVNEHTNDFARIPQALQAKAAAQLEKEAWEYYQIRFLSAGPGVIQIDISQSSLQRLLTWFSGFPVACVDLEPRDVLSLAGNKRDAGSLALLRRLENNGTPEQLQRLLPDEIHDTFYEAMTDAVFGNHGPTVEEELLGEEYQEWQRERFLHDLRDMGVEVPADSGSALEPAPVSDNGYPQGFGDETVSTPFDPERF